MPQAAPKRDHAMFDGDLSGTMLNLYLLRGLMAWLAPYHLTLALSGPPMAQAS